MANFDKKISDTAVRIGPVRFCYANVFHPRKKEDGSDGKYGITPLIDESDAARLKLINDAINAAKELAKTKGIKLTSTSKTPLRNGDTDRPDDETFAGKWFFNANCQKKPGVFVRQDDGTIVPALDEDDFYSGCWGVVTVNFYPYDSNGNKGVGAGLNNVMKTQDGDRLSGGSSAASDFGDLGSFGDPLDCLN